MLSQDQDIADIALRPIFNERSLQLQRRCVVSDAEAPDLKVRGRAHLA
jgi:hypothetical protein